LTRQRFPLVSATLEKGRTAWIQTARAVSEDTQSELVKKWACLCLLSPIAIAVDSWIFAPVDDLEGANNDRRVAQFLMDLVPYFRGFRLGADAENLGVGA